MKYFKYATVLISWRVSIGNRTKIWHFYHILQNVKNCFCVNLLIKLRKMLQFFIAEYLRNNLKIS
jgi:hypothetical protein